VQHVDVSSTASAALAPDAGSFSNSGAHRASAFPAAQREHRWLIGLILLAVVFRLATLGGYPLMDKTEARYAEVGRKMLETGDWILPPAASAQFYTRGEFVSAWKPGEAYIHLADAPRNFFAAKRDQIESMPASVGQRLEPVAECGRYLLMRESAAALP
jgi:hypothetical protein